MIYDSVRQSKTSIRTSFGIGRFNTRLNFYIFEIHKLNYINRKNMYNFRTTTKKEKIRTSLLLKQVDLYSVSYSFIK